MPVKRCCGSRRVAPTSKRGSTTRGSSAPRRCRSVHGLSRRGGHRRFQVREKLKSQMMDGDQGGPCQPVRTVLTCATGGYGVHRVMRSRSAFAVALLVTLATLPSTATAATPQNGRIAFARLFPAQIFTMAPNGTDLTRLTLSKMPNWDPAWSTDGTQIAFVRAEPGWDGSKLMLMFADGSGKSVVRRSNQDLLGPDWFPDGAHIVMFRDANGIASRTRMMIAATDGSNVIQVGPDGASSPSVSPDGTMIAFVQYRRDAGSHRNVWVMNADGSDLTQITTDGRSSAPAWSPDGSQIVFLRRVKSPSDPWQQTDVFVMNADGTNQTRLTETRRFEYAPTWSPDGTLILFEQTTYWDQYTSTDLWTMMPDGSNRIELLDTPGVYEWSPDWQAA